MNMMPVQRVPVRMEQHVSTMAKATSASVQMVLRVPIVKQTSMIVTPVPALLLLSVLT